MGNGNGGDEMRETGDRRGGERDEMGNGQTEEERDGSLRTMATRCVCYDGSAELLFDWVG